MRSIARGAVVMAVACLLGTESPGQSFSPDEYLKFGDRLAEAGDYYRAITEYSRFIFLCPSNALVPHVQYKIAMAYFNGRKWDAAVTHFTDLRETYAGQPVGKSASLMLADTYYQMAQYSKAEGVLGEFESRYAGNDWMDQVRLREGVCLLRLGNPSWARDSFAGVSTNSEFRRVAEALDANVDTYGKLAEKSPLCAAGLSAVIPGAGQLYIDRPHDALISFLVNGVMIVGAVQAYRNDERVAGAFLAGIESVWYFGNIYNAASGAHKFNQRERDVFFSDLQIRYGIFTEPGQKDRPVPSIGIGVKF